MSVANLRGVWVGSMATLSGMLLDPLQPARIDVELVTLVGNLPDSYEIQAIAAIPLLPLGGGAMLVLGVGLIGWRRLRAH